MSQQSKEASNKSPKTKSEKPIIKKIPIKRTKTSPKTKISIIIPTATTKNINERSYLLSSITCMIIIKFLLFLCLCICGNINFAICTELEIIKNLEKLINFIFEIIIKKVEIIQLKKLNFNRNYNILNIPH